MRDLEPGELVGERYLIEDQIGRGGMAIVYRVRHTQLDTLHALKVVSVSAQSVRRRMMQEGRVQAALRHVNIVAVTDIIVVDDSPGLVMEYIRGPSLEDWLDKNRLSVGQADELVAGVLKGVGAAHAHGLIHRDLKPANVMLALGEGTLIPKVADFGLVKMLSEDDDGDELQSKTRTGVAMGTPPYMAPEQIRDSKNVDARADVFSLGAILYEMVSGERAFVGKDVLEIFNSVANGIRVPIRERVPELPERMEAAIVGALMVDPDERIKDVPTLLATWMGKTDAIGESNWGHDLMDVAQSLGAGGEGTKEYLNKSFRSNLEVTKHATATQHDPGQTVEDVGDPKTDPTMFPDMLDGQPDTIIKNHVEVAGDTLFMDDAPAAPAQPTGGRANVGIAVAGSMLGLGGVGVALVAVLGVGLWAAFGPSADLPTPPDVPSVQTDPKPPIETVQTDPEPPAPEVPPPSPEPTTPAPEPEPDPVAEAAPETPPATEPIPEPDNDAVAEVVPPPEPDPPAEPLPPAPTGPTVSLVSDVTVILRDKSGNKADINALSPGEYTVVAFFEPTRPTTQSRVNMPAGSKWLIRCSRGARRCNVTPQ